MFWFRKLHFGYRKEARFYSPLHVPRRVLAKQEKHFVADEMNASVLITEAMGKIKDLESNNVGTETETVNVKYKKVCSNFLGSLIKGGVSQHALAARVNARLKLEYQIDNPIQLAIDSVKPLLEYKTMVGRKQTLPKLLTPHRQNGVAIRWLIEAAKSRKYNTVVSLERGLFDEIAEIFAGTSSLYAKRFNMHKPI